VLENKSQSNKLVGVTGFIVLAFFIASGNSLTIKGIPARIESTLEEKLERKNR
jgi:hypothetical protein